jgi:hypothetical protein
MENRTQLYRLYSTRFFTAKNATEFNSPLKQSRIQHEGHMVYKRTPSTDGVGTNMLQFQCSRKEEQKKERSTTANIVYHGCSATGTTACPAFPWWHWQAIEALT